MMGAYWTIQIPWVPRKFSTPWHPTDESGPFSVLSRGAFLTRNEAIDWGLIHLGGCPYTITKVEAEAAFEPQKP
jgi:hypothetical protein